MFILVAKKIPKFGNHPLEKNENFDNRSWEIIAYISQSATEKKIANFENGLLFVIFFSFREKKNGEFWVNIADTNSEFHHSVAKENRNFVQQSRENSKIQILKFNLLRDNWSLSSIVLEI